MKYSIQTFIRILHELKIKEHAAMPVPVGCNTHARNCHIYIYVWCIRYRDIGKDSVVTSNGCQPDWIRGMCSPLRSVPRAT